MNKAKNISRLIKACQQREYKAQRELYYMLIDDLYRLVKRYVRDDYYTKNTLQDVFLKIYNNIDKYDENKGTFKAWVNTVAIRLCLNKLKSIKKHVSVEEGFAPVFSQEPSVYERINKNELDYYLSRLNERHRNVYVLHEIEGYKHLEIADKLGLSESSSRTYLFRARQELIKEYKKRII